MEVKQKRPYTRRAKPNTTLKNKDESVYQCVYCKKIMSRLATLNVHLRIHTGEKPYVCKYCPKLFRHRVTRNNHQFKCENQHKNQNQKIHRDVQSHSGSVFPEKKRRIFDKHLTASNSTKSRSLKLSEKSKSSSKYNDPNSSKRCSKLLPFSCKNCCQRFIDYDQLLVHDRKHHRFNIRPYSCHRCGRRFQLKPQLDKHRKIHRVKIILVGFRNSHHSPIAGSSKIPFLSESTLSSKTNSKKSILKISNKNNQYTANKGDNDNHQGFSCFICKRICKSEQILKAHHLVHLGEKIHPCRYCPKSFVRVAERNVHEKRMHLNIKPYECPGCGNRYTLKSTLRHHQSKNCNPDKARRLRRNQSYNYMHKQAPAQRQVQKQVQIRSKTKTNENKPSRHRHLFQYKLGDNLDNLSSQFTTYHRVHITSDKKYVTYKLNDCRFCRKRFMNVEKMKLHTLTCTKRILVSCPTCSKTYPCQIYLRKHMKRSARCHRLRQKLGTFQNQIQNKYSSKNNSASKLGSESEASVPSIFKKSSNDFANSSLTSASTLSASVPLFKRNVNQSSTSKLKEGSAYARRKLTLSSKNLESKTSKHRAFEEPILRLKGNHNSKFDQRVSMHENLKGVRINGEPFFKCGFCSKKFQSKYYSHALEHTWTHTGYKPYRCKVCKKGFIRSKLLEEHEFSCRENANPRSRSKDEDDQDKHKNKDKKKESRNKSGPGHRKSTGSMSIPREQVHGETNAERSARELILGI